MRERVVTSLRGDTQTFAWNLRSTTYNNSVVRFVPAAAAALQNTSALLSQLVDPTFTYSQYNQSAFTIQSGIFAGYDLLSITVQAKRISTMSSIFLVLPLCIVGAALCMVMHQEPAKDSRLSVPLSSITATMAFSFVVSNQCPPVSYTTRIHLLIFQTYVFSVAALLLNYYLWCIEFAKKELAAANNKKKTLLADSQALAKRVKGFDIKDAAAKDRSSATKVIVLPEGIHKPKPAPAPEPAPEKPKEDTGDAKEAAGKLLDVVPAEAAGPTQEVKVDIAAASKDGGTAAPAGAGAGASKVAPEPAERSEATGAFKNEEGQFRDVLQLLDADEVKTFKKLNWGGGPIKMLFGTRLMTNQNVDGWGKWVERIDNVAKNAFPVAIAVTIASILAVPNLAGLGAGPVQVLGTPDSGH